MQGPHANQNVKYQTCDNKEFETCDTNTWSLKICDTKIWSLRYVIHTCDTKIKSDIHTYM